MNLLWLLVLVVSRENVEEQDNTTVNYDGYADGTEADLARTEEALHFADTYFKLMSNVKEVPFDNQTNIQSFIIENIGKELYEHFDVLKKNIGKLNSILEKNIIKTISRSSCGIISIAANDLKDFGTFIIANEKTFRKI